MKDGVEDVPVLVVGAGPAGLTAAITLARNGVRCLVTERRAKPSAVPKATAVSLRSMELLRSWGLEAAVRAGGNDVEWLLWSCATLAGAADGSSQPVGLPTIAQSQAISPTAPACVPQDHLEAVLVDHLRSLPAARYRPGVEVVGLDHGPDGITATLRDTHTGDGSTVRARYVAAADGVHSTVRSELGIAMHGPGRVADRVMVLFHAPLASVVGEHRYGIYWVPGPDGTGESLLPAGRSDRWQYAFEWDAEAESLADYDAERLTTQLRRATGVADLRPRIVRVDAFSFTAQLAERFRDGDVFLVGDAAHQISPRGGTGMNTAIGDGYDLGWKLSWVLDGWADPSLLDTYETERRPVALHNVTRSADPNGSVRDVADEIHADLGGRIAHAWLPTPTGRHSTLDLVGPGLTLLTTAPDPAEHAAAADSRVPVLVRNVDDVTAARALGLHGEGSVLVRPDGVPVHRWPTPAYARWVGRDPRPTTTASVDQATDTDVATVVEPLFRDYGRWLALRLRDDHRIDYTDADLEGHHTAFRAQIAQLLAPPGRLVVARVGDHPAGVGALKPVDAVTAEVKRMYVRPGHQGQGVGRAVLRHLLAAARADGFHVVRLKTMRFMTAALALYRSLGFTETPPFDGSETTGTPMEAHTVFMALQLEELRCAS